MAEPSASESELIDVTPAESDPSGGETRSAKTSYPADLCGLLFIKDGNLGNFICQLCGDFLVSKKQSKNGPRRANLSPQQIARHMKASHQKLSDPSVSRETVL